MYVYVSSTKIVRKKNENRNIFFNIYRYTKIVFLSLPVFFFAFPLDIYISQYQIG